MSGELPTEAGDGAVAADGAGLTSYHLRRMAEHGFVEEVPELAKGRERWWRAVPSDRRFPPYSRQSPEMREALTQMHKLNLAELVEEARKFESARDALGPWADAALFSRATLRVDPARLAEFFEEYVALIQRYSAPQQDQAPDTRAVLVRLVRLPETD
ncbi:ArsR family transcriptional regulator [Streptomyces sp. NPDC037389]|uniref:ArsR family transcriptional regulator n=1 Tax=Streptomyces sp. NPDC037389 TaxID=3155369 RepID=UPI00340A4F5A